MPHDAHATVIAGVTITHPSRVLFAEPGLTKAALAAYYVTVADRMLPHVVDRPLSLVRCPQGHEGHCFFQKHWIGPVPDGLQSVDLTEESGARAPYLVIRDVRGLVGLVQHGVLEIHVWGAKASDIDHPDRLVLDFDPGPDVVWSEVMRTAMRARALMQAIGLRAWLKSTGGKGLHVVVPIAPTVSWDALREVARLTTTHLVARDPTRLVDVAAKAKRQGKIFVDYLRNSRGATAVAPWSSRARDGAPVAAPLAWRDLATLSSGAPVRVDDIAPWLARHPRDPWRALGRSTQRLDEHVMERLFTAMRRSARPRALHTP